MRRLFWSLMAGFIVLSSAVTFVWSGGWVLFVLIGPLCAVGLWDCLQKRQTVRRNFPVIGHMRYLMEAIRPEINQYFVESNRDGVPFNRESRSIIYQRAKHALDTVPFGTQCDVYAAHYEWINHSLAPKTLDLEHPPRVRIGGQACKQPYEAALLNISAMSYGSLSSRAILALNGGAKRGGFYHNTGEGGLTQHHLAPGGDIVWQLGTAYFGARDAEGRFDPSRFRDKAQLPNVKMIEIKLSQGAKPGHGGILPAAKITPEIMAIRGVVAGKDVISPPAHSAFYTPLELLEFINTLRELSGGKPVGFKLCIGKRREFLAIVKAMLQTGCTPDFITVDGAEGGTGAAPLEFSNSVGTPLREGLSFVHNTLRGAHLRDRIRLIAAGKVATGFNMATSMAIGADICNAARAMMFALGCIQSLRCHSNNCPTGVATQDRQLVAGLDVTDKTVRVWNFQRETVKSLMEVIAAAGLEHPHELRPYHILRRTSAAEVHNLEEIYAYQPPGFLLDGAIPKALLRPWQEARADSFAVAAG